MPCSNGAALHRHVRKGHLDIVKELLLNPAVNSADVNSVGNKGRIPLHLASKFGHVEIVIELLKCGAKIDSRDEDLRTTLHLASLNREIGTVSSLVRSFADLTRQRGQAHKHIYQEALRLHEAVSYR